MSRIWRAPTSGRQNRTLLAIFAPADASRRGSHAFCNQPPWGELVAVNVNTGDIAWRVPLGITESLPADKQNTGRPGEGRTDHHRFRSGVRGHVRR